MFKADIYCKFFKESFKEGRGEMLKDYSFNLESNNIEKLIDIIQDNIDCHFSIWENMGDVNHSDCNQFLTSRICDENEASPNNVKLAKFKKSEIDLFCIDYDICIYELIRIPVKSLEK